MKPTETLLSLLLASTGIVCCLIFVAYVYLEIPKRGDCHRRSGDVYLTFTKAPVFYEVVNVYLDLIIPFC